MYEDVSNQQVASTISGQNYGRLSQLFGTLLSGAAKSSKENSSPPFVVKLNNVAGKFRYPLVIYLV